MIILFCCSTRFITVVVFWVIIMKIFKASTRWWPCWCRKRFSGLRKLKKFERFEMQNSLVPGAQMFSDINGANRIHLCYTFLCWWKWLHWWLQGAFFVFALGLGRTSPVLQFYWNFCNCVPETICQQFDWFWSFFVRMCFVSSSSYLFGLQSAKLLDCTSLSMTSNSLDLQLEGNLIFSLNLPVLFSHSVI